MWYSLLDLKMPETGEIRAQVMVPPDSPWFSGHFPDHPILPGIAQLKMVADVIVRAGQPCLGIKRLTRVKFKKIVKPGERLEIHAAATATAGLYSFRITHEAQDVCSGMMTLADNPNSKLPMTNDIDQTISRIAAIIINELKLEDVTPATFNADLDLVDEVGIDSMDLATIALVIRDEFGVRIDEDDYPKLTTIRIIAEYIADKRSSGE